MPLPWALLAGVSGLRGAAAAGPSLTQEAHLLVRGAPAARVFHHAWVGGRTSARPCGGPEMSEAAGDPRASVGSPRSALSHGVCAPAPRQLLPGGCGSLPAVGGVGKPFW